MDPRRNIRAARRLLKTFPTVRIHDSVLAALLDARPSMTSEELAIAAILAFASIEVGTDDHTCSKIDSMLRVATFVRGLPGFETGGDLARTLDDALAALVGRDPATRLQ